MHRTRRKAEGGGQSRAQKEPHPASPGHMLIISRTGSKDYFELSREVHDELYVLIHKCKSLIESVYSPDGYNIGFNCGEAAGQTVSRFHCHVIPRYKEDMKDDTKVSVLSPPLLYSRS